MGAGRRCIRSLGSRFRSRGDGEPRVPGVRRGWSALRVAIRDPRRACRRRPLRIRDPPSASARVGRLEHVVRDVQSRRRGGTSRIRGPRCEGRRRPVHGDPFPGSGGTGIRRSTGCCGSSARKHSPPFCTRPGSSSTSSSAIGIGARSRKRAKRSSRSRGALPRPNRKPAAKCPRSSPTTSASPGTASGPP